MSVKYRTPLLSLAPSTTLYPSDADLVAPAPIRAEGLQPNGDFGDGSFTGWFLGPSGGATVQLIEQINGGDFRYQAHGVVPATPAAAYIMSASMIPVDEARRYFFNARVRKVSGVASTGSYLRIVCYAADGTQLGLAYPTSDFFTLSGSGPLNGFGFFNAPSDWQRAGGSFLPGRAVYVNGTGGGAQYRDGFPPGTAKVRVQAYFAYQPASEVAVEFEDFFFDVDPVEFGVPIVSSGAPVAPAGIPSSEAWGTPTVSFVNTVAPDAIKTEEAFGVALPLPSDSLTPSNTLYPDDQGFQVVFTAPALAPTSIPSEEAWGTPTITSNSVVYPDSIPSAESFDSFFPADTVFPGDDVFPSGITVKFTPHIYPASIGFDGVVSDVWVLLLTDYMRLGPAGPPRRGLRPARGRYPGHIDTCRGVPAVYRPPADVPSDVLYPGCFLYPRPEGPIERRQTLFSRGYSVPALRLFGRTRRATLYVRGSGFPQIVVVDPTDPGGTIQEVVAFPSNIHTLELPSNVEHVEFPSKDAS